MDAPQISRSGRVLKKSTKVKEMEDFDINELDGQGKSRKKSKAMDESDEFDDKRVAPIKIPKISLNMQGGAKKKIDISSANKQVFKSSSISSPQQSSFQNTMKAKQDSGQSIYNDSSDASRETDSSSMSSESSSSSSSPQSSSSDGSSEEPFPSEYRGDRKVTVSSRIPSKHQDKVIVEQHQHYESPVYMEPSSGMSSDESEDSALVIAEDSEESASFQKSIVRKRVGKNDPAYAPRPSGRRKRPFAQTNAAAAKKKTAPPKKRTVSAYMLFCRENRKKIAASSGNIGFANIGKKVGEAWSSLPEKEKMAWKNKAKRLSMKSSGNINASPSSSVQSKASNRSAASISEELLKSSPESEGVLGTTPIDVAAHLKLLGDSLTVIGQRLIEHEGQLAVSGIYSVLLDTLLCAVGPLLCLTTEIAGLEHLPRDVLEKTLDHIAYFMPGL